MVRDVHVNITILRRFALATTAYVLTPVGFFAFGVLIAGSGALSSACVMWVFQVPARPGAVKVAITQASTPLRGGQVRS